MRATGPAAGPARRLGVAGKSAIDAPVEAMDEASDLARLASLACCRSGASARAGEAALAIARAGDSGPKPNEARLALLVAFAAVPDWGPKPAGEGNAGDCPSRNALSFSGRPRLPRGAMAGSS